MPDTAGRPDVCHGDPDVAEDNEILRTLVGSTMLGLAVGDTDDTDLLGVFIEPPEYVIGLRPPYKTHTRRTQPEGARSGPGDVDLSIYSLRHYLALCAAGNPTVLMPLWAPERFVHLLTPLGADLRALAPAFLSQQVGHRFLGYLRGQHDRIVGVNKQGRMPNRPELVSRYGFDTKYAYAALRLGMQGVELLHTGGLTLPMPQGQRDLLLDLRTGGFTLPQALGMIAEQERALEALLAPGGTSLPARPDTARIEAWSIAAHLTHWSAHD